MRSKFKILSCIVAVVLCMTAFSFSTFATGDYYASNENEMETPPDSIDEIIIGTEDVKLPNHGSSGAGNPLTPDGNLSLIDDILQSDSFESVESELAEKQFITVQSKNGNYFYLVIDRSGDTENVYFLNLVDEADLLALMEEKESEETVVVCSCTDKCLVGSINTGCEICRTNMSECAGKEAVVEPKPDPEPTPEPDIEKPADTKKSNGGPVLAILIVLLGGGFAVYWFKFRNSEPTNKGSDDLNDYDFGQEAEEEETEIDDADLMAEVEGKEEKETHEDI